MSTKKKEDLGLSQSSGTRPLLGSERLAVVYFRDGRCRESLMETIFKGVKKKKKVASVRYCRELQVFVAYNETEENGRK